MSYSSTRMNIPVFSLLRNIKPCKLTRCLLTGNRYSQLERVSCLRQNHIVKHTVSFTTLQPKQLNSQIVRSPTEVKTEWNIRNISTFENIEPAPGEDRIYLEAFIPYSCRDPEELLNFFEVDKSMVQCDILIDKTGSHFGCAILQTEEKEMARKILSKIGVAVPGSRFLVDVRTLDMQRAKALLGKLVVQLRGIPFSWHKMEVSEFCGNKDSKIIMPGSNAAGNSGTAYVQFPTEEDTQWAIKTLHKQQAGNRYIEVYPSSLVEAFVHARRLKNRKPPMGNSTSFY